MTADELPSNEEMGQHLRDQLDASDEDRRQVAEFSTTVATMARGPLRELLCEVARAYEDFSMAAEVGGTTLGEEQRMHQVMRSAIRVQSWLSCGR